MILLYTTYHKGLTVRVDTVCGSDHTFTRLDLSDMQKLWELLAQLNIDDCIYTQEKKNICKGIRFAHLLKCLCLKKELGFEQ